MKMSPSQFNQESDDMKVKLLYKLHLGHLNADPSIVNTLLRLGDQSGVYSSEEETAINKIYTFLEGDKDLKSFRKFVPKSFIIVGLRVCKMDAELVFRTAKSIFNVNMTSHPDLVARIRAENLKEIAAAKMFQIIKRPVSDGPVVILFRVKAWNPDVVNLEELVLYSVIFYMTAAKHCPQFQRSGFLLIGDMDGFKLTHARHMTTLDILSKIGTFLTKIPTKMVKGSVLINCYSVFSQAFNVVKWVLPRRVRKIMHVTKKDTSPITRLISRDKLPIELGGTIPNEDAFDEQVSNELLSDPNLIPNIKFLINETLIFTGYKQRN